MTMTPTPRTTTAAIALGAIAVVAVSCSSEPIEPIEPPAFALTSANVVVPAGDTYPVNLIFVASDGDPIWTDLSGIELPGDASVGPGEFDVIRGDGSGGYHLGNITLELSADEGLTFDSVGLIYTDATEPVSVDVGSWTLAEAAPDDFATADTKAEVAAMAGCTSADLPVPDTVAAVTGFRTGSPDVEVDDATLDQESQSVRITLTCTDTADFHVISPALDYTDTDGGAKTTRLAPIAIGFQDIDDADLARIRSR